MRTRNLSRLTDASLLRELTGALANERASTADVLAYLGEVDERRLYVPAGYESLYAFCVGQLHLSEDSACRRTKAARTARRFPAILDAVIDGRLHLSAVVVLAPNLTQDNVDELIAMAAHKTKAQVEGLVARLFPRNDVDTRVEAISPAVEPALLAELSALGRINTPEQLAGKPAESASQTAPGQQVPWQKVTPLAPQRFAVQFTMDQETHDALRYAQELLGHQISSGDVAEVFKRALLVFVTQLEKRKFGTTSKPRPRKQSEHSPVDEHYIPMPVRHAVWKRDGGQCTFVSDSGHRCEARKDLQFDHIIPRALGGESTVPNLRLRCHAHNQCEAELVFGAGFMREKRELRQRAAKDRAAAKKRAAAEAKARAAPLHTAVQEEVKDVIAGLRELGYSAKDACRAAESSEYLIDATLEERMRAALRFLCPKVRVQRFMEIPGNC